MLTRIDKTNKYPVKLRVTFDRKSQEYQTRYDLEPEDYEKLSLPRVSSQLQEVREKLKEIQRKAKDFWLFSYFANGINSTDIAHLKYKNMEGEFITFERTRQKTPIGLGNRFLFT